jgi:hypothetical protein
LPTSKRSQSIDSTHVRRIDWIIAALLLLCALYTLPRWSDPNQNSRLDMVIAVVDDGTFQIDPYVQNTVDYAKVGDHYYSDKAPGAAFLGIPVYAVLDPILDSDLAVGLTDSLASHDAFRSTMRAEGSGVSEEKVRFALLQTALAAVVAALPTALIGVLLWRLALHLTGSVGASVVAAVAYAIATPAFAYSNAVYGHQLAAFLLVAAFALVALADTKPGPLRLVGVGVLLAFSVVTEYPALLPAGILFLYTAAVLVRARSPYSLVYVAVSGLLVASGWMVYNATVFNGPLDLGYGYSELWVDQHSTGFMSLSMPTFEGAWGVTFGLFRGLFVLAPWLLLAIPGFVVWWRDRQWRLEWAASLACALSMLAFNISSHMWWGGFAVGPRYLLPGLPFAVLAAAFALAHWAHRPWFRWLAAALLVWSFGATWFLALANQAFPSDVIQNPFVDYALPAWESGNIARNVGTLVGLQGAASLAPLVVLGSLLGLACWELVRGYRHTPHGVDPVALTGE